MKIIYILLHPYKSFLRLKIKYYKKRKNYQNFAKNHYQLLFGKKINWENPEDYNQWMHWLAYKTDTTVWSLYADKYRVRDFIKNKGFEDILVPLYAVWENPEEIDFKDLPERFVLKLNNGSGDIKIINDKNKVDINEIKEYFKSKLEYDYVNFAGETHYTRIKPVIIAEKLLDVSKQPIQTSSLIDYKIWTFNGKAESILVCYDRSRGLTKLMTYDLNWQPHPEWSADSHHYSSADKIVPPPINLERMIQIAQELSKGQPQMRVDFYEEDDRLYFGEITMTSSAMKIDVYSEYYLKHLGDLCKNAYLVLKNK